MNTKDFSILNFNFSVAEIGRPQLGTISINKKGELNVSKGVISGLSSEDLFQMCTRALSAYNILKTGQITGNLLTYVIHKFPDRYSITQVILGKETHIGCILLRNKHLIFQIDIPEYIRNMCIYYLSTNAQVDFYYNGLHYDCN